MPLPPPLPLPLRLPAGPVGWLAFAPAAVACWSDVGAVVGFPKTLPQGQPNAWPGAPIARVATPLPPAQARGRGPAATAAEPPPPAEPELAGAPLGGAGNAKRFGGCRGGLFPFPIGRSCCRCCCCCSIIRFWKTCAGSRPAASSQEACWNTLVISIRFSSSLPPRASRPVSRRSFNWVPSLCSEAVRCLEPEELEEAAPSAF